MSTSLRMPQCRCALDSRKNKMVCIQEAGEAMADNSEWQNSKTSGSARYKYLSFYWFIHFVCGLFVESASHFSLSLSLSLSHTTHTNLV